MSQGRSGKKIWLWAAALVLVAGAAAAAQETPQPSPGIDIGNYNVQNAVEVGWRYANFTGSQANYDTFVNLHSGVRLLNFSLGLRSLNHQGSLFDNLSLTGFGFGGDPSDVARLNVSKNKWYNFDATFRRDKYFWNYNQFANPLNPTSSNPAVAITFSPHELDLSRAMSDFRMTLLPEARWHIRLGYSRVRLEGPGLSTLHVGTEAALFQNWHTITDEYQAGIDFNFIPKTTLSYDQFVQHFKQDTAWVDDPLSGFGISGLSLFQLSNGTPVDFGVSWDTANRAPCSTPIADATTTPPTATPTCSAYTSYTRNARPRLTMPTERFSFQTNFIPRLSMVGAVNYTSTEQTSRNQQELFTGFESRTNGRVEGTAGNANAKQIIVGANWGAVFQVTNKFRIVDAFYYNSYRLPGQFDFANLALFPQIDTATGKPDMLAPLGVFPSEDCPAPYTASTCPQHTSSSAADLAAGSNLRYLGQEIRTNTFSLEYQFTPRWGARLGYRYLRRKVFDFDAVKFNQEIFFPGGSAGAAAAARGDCAIPSGGTFPDDLPEGCVLQTSGPLTGAVIFSGFTEDSDDEHEQMIDLNGHSALFGFWGRPTDKLRTSFDLELYSADPQFLQNLGFASMLTRLTPRQLQHYRARISYVPVPWAQLSGNIDILEHRDNVLQVRDVEHNRSYSVTGVFSPNERFNFDLTYSFNDIYTQAIDCFQLASGSTPPAGNTACPVPIDEAEFQVNTGALSTYTEKSHFVNADVMFKPVKRVTLWAGYAGNFVRGTPAFFNLNDEFVSNFLNPNSPWGPLRFGYQRPYVNLDFAITNRITYKAGWTYYGYNTHAPADPATLVPLGNQDFNGNIATFSVRYTL